MRADDPRHGTSAGYMAHRSAGEAACAPCKAGRAEYQRRRDYDMQLGRPRRVPSLGAQRRIRALQRLGWSLRMIANEAGWNNAEDLYYALHNPSCNRSTWLRIAQTYERLCMTIPPHSSATVRARRRAERLDYAPPLAWDDIDRDPAPVGVEVSREGVDPAIVARCLAGDFAPAKGLARSERIVVADAWVAAGRSQNELERATGWNVTRDRREERRASEVAA